MYIYIYYIHTYIIELDGWKEGTKEGRIDGWMDGKKKGRKGGRKKEKKGKMDMNGRMDTYIHRYIDTLIH